LVPPEEIAKSPELKQRIEKEIDGINEHLGNWEKIKKIELTPEYGALNQGFLRLL
jgi:long-chain acyl-CoA synthetase